MFNSAVKIDLYTRTSGQWAHEWKKFFPYKNSFGIGNIGSISPWMNKIPYLIRAVSGLADGGYIKTRGKRQQKNDQLLYEHHAGTTEKFTLQTNNTCVASCSRFLLLHDSEDGCRFTRWRNLKATVHWWETFKIHFLVTSYWHFFWFRSLVTLAIPSFTGILPGIV